MTKTEIGKSYHMVCSINWAREILLNNKANKRPQVLFESPKGIPKTYDECFYYLADLEQRGFKFVPSCQNHDKEGRCKGHPIKE